jgi:hypothetical protein
VVAAQGHFALVNHQLLRIRTGFAIARVLGRALIIPPVHCGLDRWWAPHSGGCCSLLLHSGIVSQDPAQ